MRAENFRKMITKVIVILLICSKLDYTTSLPDIIRIGENFPRYNNKRKIIFLRRRKSFFHAAQGDASRVASASRQMENKRNIKHRSSEAF